MANAKRNAASQSPLSPLIDSLRDTIVGAIGRMMKEKVMKLEKMALEATLGLVFLAVAIFFFLAALVFFLKEYAQFTYAASFFCVGLVALVIAFVIYELFREN